MFYDEIATRVRNGERARETEHNFEIYLKDFGIIDGVHTRDFVQVDDDGNEVPFNVTVEHLLSDTWSIVEEESSTETSTEAAETTTETTTGTE